MKKLLEEIKFSVVPNLIVVPPKKRVPMFSICLFGKVVNFGTKYVTDWPVGFRAFGAPNTTYTSRGAR